VSAAELIELQGDAIAIDMRASCRCGSSRGIMRRIGGQDTVRCAACDAFQYNAPRSETGTAPPRSERSVDDQIMWGKYKGITYRELARHHTGYCAWAARKIGGLNGQLCAEALADHMGIR